MNSNRVALSSVLGLPFYQAAFRFTRLFFKDFGVELWARNSLVFEEIVPLLSDIDLTFDCGDMPNGELLALLRRYRRVKRIVPVLGESHFISNGRKEFLFEFQNPFELARDPLLIEKYGWKAPTTAGDGEKFVFLSRMLRSDLVNLTKRPSLRIAKWTRHLRAVGMESNFHPFTAESLVSFLDEALFFELTDLPVGEVLRTPPGELPKGERHRLALLLANPARWLIEAMVAGELGRSLLELDRLGATERSIVVLQARWELSALCAQLEWLESPGVARNHLSRILNLVRFVSLADYSKLSQSFARIGIFSEDEISAPPEPALVSKTFCILPWTELKIDVEGRVPICLKDEVVRPAMSVHSRSLEEISGSLQAVKSSMLQGEAVSQCRGCYRDESAGLKSQRLVSNENFKSAPTGGIFSHAGLKVLRLGLGSQCKLTCVGCSPQLSSAWADFMMLASGDSPPGAQAQGRPVWYLRPEVLDSLRLLLNQVDTVALSGGEPLSAPGFSEFLEFLAEAAKIRRIRLIIETSGAVDFSPFFWGASAFKTIDLLVRAEGIEDQNAYLRYPMVWEEWVENLEKIDAAPDNVNIHISYQTHPISAYYLPEFLKWALAQGSARLTLGLEAFGIELATRSDSETLIMQATPASMRPALRQRLRTAVDLFPSLQVGVEAVIHRMDSGQSDTRRVARMLSALDRHRGMQFVRVFPELAPHFFGA